MSGQGRVIFFSKRDMARFNMLEKAEKLLERPQEFSVMDLNSLLEFHHIHQYFENDLYLDGWTTEQKTAYQQIVKSALTAIPIFLNDSIPAGLMTEINQLDFNNRKNFWELLRYFELYRKVDKENFTGLLMAYPHHIRYILPLKQMVQHFDGEIRSFLLTYDESAELLLSHFEEKLTEPSDYFFPKSLTDSDKNTIILAYLDSPEPNLNYVELVRNSKYLKLPPKILLKAKQTSESIKDEMFTDENTTKISVAATLDPNQMERIIFTGNGKDTTASYGGLFFDSLDTDIQLIRVFGDVFIYTDEQGLITLVNKDAEMDTLEKIFMQSRNEYHTGFTFARKNMMSLAQLGILNHYLIQKGRSIEKVLEGFIKEFFTVTFKLKGLTFNMPDAKLGPAEKIRLLAPEMEYLLKQFKNFVTDGAVDHELLQIDSTPVYFSEIPSLVQKKYIYSSHENIKTIQYHFFDENSLLADRKDSSNRNTLFQWLRTDSVHKSDFEDYQLPCLEQAVKAGDLTIDGAGKIEMTDPVKVIIAGKLRKNGAISYWHFALPFRATIDRLIADGLLETSDQLFTTDEISYLNFYLNKKEFSNSKDLRNKYLHGSNNRDLKQQELDYLYFLRTFILILLKLKDDVELKSANEQK